jgi:SAM-dependent methyltransferase
MNDRLAKRSAEAYGRYSDKYASVLEPYLRPIADEVIRQGSIQGQQRVMDLATGTGLIARKFASTDASIVGVDNSFGSLLTARELSSGGIPFIAGDAHSLPFMDGSFDLVTCVLSLSHFSRVSTALAEIRRVLSAEGWFLAAAWGAEKKDLSISAAFGVIERYLEDDSDPSEDTIDEETWANADHGCDALRQASFVNVQAITLTLSGSYRDAIAAVDWALAWPLVQTRIDVLGFIDQERLRLEAISSVNGVNELSWQRDINYFQAMSTGR